jgi:predicted kinase
MDFDFHGRRDLARRFSTQMARALRDRGMLRLLDFYKCYRACVRGKVESFRHCTAGLAEREQLKSRDRATRYLRLALEYAIRGSKPMVLVVMGRVGSGKSTLARLLGEQLNWEIISSDRLRKELAGVPLHQRGPGMVRRRLYSERMNDQTYSALARHAAKMVREEKSVILDATFGRRRRRHELGKMFNRAGVDFCFVETRASATATVRRLQKRARSAGEISDARIEDLPALNRAYEPPGEVAREHFVAVQTTRARNAAVRATLRALALRRASRTSP